MGGDCLFLGSRLANSLLLKCTRLAWDKDGILLIIIEVTAAFLKRMIVMFSALPSYREWRQ